MLVTKVDKSDDEPRVNNVRLVKEKAKKTKRKRTTKRRKRSTRILRVPIPTFGKG